MTIEPLQVTLLVIESLEKLDIPYLIGGSLASAVHGVIRSTLDSDIIADLAPGQSQALASSLGSGFYADVDAIRSAIEHKTSFNIIHLETMFKVDIFPLKARAFEQSEMERRTSLALSDDPDRRAYVASPEDLILAKLEWFRIGGEVSERQWRDVLGIIRVQSDHLEKKYLEEWATVLHVSDLLKKALKEAGGLI